MDRNKLVVLIYVAVIAASLFYFGVLQQFGFKGMEFEVGGKDRIISPLDVLILLVTIVSFFLLLISLVAYKRTDDTRILIVSLAFFFFAVKELLFTLENFFPEEFIYTGNAERVLELLILISFMMLMYGTYKRSTKAAKKRR